MHARPFNDRITISDQPTEEDLEALRRDGYTGVVNLRHPGEPDQPLSPSAEGERARALGMAYLHHGVGGAPLSREGVDQVLDFLEAQAPGKVLVHCRRGSRAVALVLLHQARAQGWRPEEALERGEAAGLKVEGNLRTLVQQYLAENPSP